MTSELSEELREYLKHCGLSKRKIAQCNGNTRMYHDLGLYGEIAEGYMEVLAENYHVDLSGFEFEKFFPFESAEINVLVRALFGFVPFDYIYRRRGKWEPLTLDRVDRAIHSKRWE